MSYNATRESTFGEKDDTIKRQYSDDDNTPRAIVALLDVIDFQLVRNARRAMLQQCYRYDVETSFEELRARWPKRNMTRQSSSSLSSAASAVTGGALRTGHPNRAPSAFITKPLLPYSTQSASLSNRLLFDKSNSKSYSHHDAQHNKRSKLMPPLSSCATTSAKRPIILNKEPSDIHFPQVKVSQHYDDLQQTTAEDSYFNNVESNQSLLIREKSLLQSSFAKSPEESSITDILSKPIELQLPGVSAIDISKDQKEDNSNPGLTSDAHVQKEVEGAGKHHVVSAKVESALSITVPSVKSPQQQQVMAIPHEASVAKQLLEQVNDPPVTEYKGYHDMLARKQKPIPDGEFNLGTIRYTMKKKLGEGGTSSVYELQGSLALKVESVMCNAWEFYIMRQAAKRCNQPSHVIAVHSYYAYRMTSFLVMDLAKHGTLLDILNEHRLKHMTSAMSESRALRIIIELLDALCDLHAAGIIHGDVKMENVVVVESSPKEDRIAFIDFGRAMDLTLVSSNVRVYPRWKPVKPGTVDPPISPPWLPWTLDYWGLAGIAHWLLFGSQIRVRQVAQSDPRWVLRQHIKRYWHKTFWDDFFDQLMNPSTAATTSTAPARLLAAARKLVDKT